MRNKIVFLLALCGLLYSPFASIVTLGGRVLATVEMPDRNTDYLPDLQSAFMEQHVLENPDVDRDVLTVEVIRDGQKLTTLTGETADVDFNAVIYEDDVKKALKILCVSPGRIHHDSFLLHISDNPKMRMAITIANEHIENASQDDLVNRKILLDGSWSMESPLIVIHQYMDLSRYQPRKDKFNATLMLECKRIISEAHNATEYPNAMTFLDQFIKDATPHTGGLSKGSLGIKIGKNLVLEITKPRGEALTKENWLEHLRDIGHFYVRGQSEQIPLSVEILLIKENIPEEQTQLTLTNMINIIKMAETLDGLDFIPEVA